MQALEKALELNPLSEDAAINLAVLLGDAGSVEEGIEILYQSYDHYPEHPLICQNLGAFHCNLRQLDEAEFFTAKAIKLGIESPAVFWNMANIFCFKDDRQKCLHFLELAIAKDETFAIQFRMDEDFRKYWSDSDFVKLIEDYVEAPETETE